MFLILCKRCSHSRWHHGAIVPETSFSRPPVPKLVQSERHPGPGVPYNWRHRA
ncbi:hypothetical protein CYLTODRAFT_423154 [Cylindrobasidium torrendii FP15055 ss-10]|uniref:Uncharacterized protein n=1 Tax=Cylindrobasidium torrendii FP15055 ss-10 TaxID=1314674 RepID=A0A0D7BB71_9AGAR|nr:hypothetical protein CYLTODRAFT_423154 [Cylindrobasidium torrendii FP15055 ss-10]